jgi:hypothetical protein
VHPSATKRPVLLEVLLGGLGAEVCFRWVAGDPTRADAENAAILEQVNRRGRVYLSNATVRGCFAHAPASPTTEPPTPTSSRSSTK